MRSRTAVALVAAIGLLASGCGDDDDDASSAPGTDSSAAPATGTTPTPAGSADDTAATSDDSVPDASGECDPDAAGTTLTYGTGFQLAAGLDPAVALGGGTAGGTELTAIYDTLMRWDAEAGDYLPHLAESVTPNATFDEWTLTLRPGVSFGNGDPLTAEDVKFSIERLATAGRSISGMAEQITSIEVTDELVLVIGLRQPWGRFPYFLSSEGGVVVNPRVVEELGDDFALEATGAGAGPFEVERFAPGEELVLSAKDDYWGGPVCIGGLRFVNVPGGGATAEALMSGELDAAIVTEAEPLADLVDAGYDPVTIVIGGVGGIILNSGRGEGRPFADVRLRQAAAHAIDAELVTERATGGLGIVATGLVAEGQALYRGVDGPAYDPELARSLVEAAVADGVSVDVTISCQQTPQNSEKAIAVGALLDAVGFRTEVEVLPGPAWSQKVLLDGNYDLACNGPTIKDDDVLKNLEAFHSESVRSRTGFSDPAVDAAIASIYAASTQDELGDELESLQHIWNEVVPSLLVNAEAWGVVSNDDVEGLVYGADHRVYFHDANLS